MHALSVYRCNKYFIKIHFEVIKCKYQLHQDSIQYIKYKFFTNLKLFYYVLLFQNIVRIRFERFQAHRKKVGVAYAISSASGSGESFECRSYNIVSCNMIQYISLNYENNISHDIIQYCIKEQYIIIVPNHRSYHIEYIINIIGYDYHII